MTVPSEKAPAVLIVEDEYMVAMHMSMLIKKLGYQVVGIAVDRQSAFALADSQPDIVLVDCKLRDGVTGPEIGQKLATETGATVIFITANPQYVEDLKLDHPKILGIYPKPVNDNEVGDVLEFASTVRKGELPTQIPAFLRRLGC
jgi:two-component system, response regulator PdtaR